MSRLNRDSPSLREGREQFGGSGRTDLIPPELPTAASGASPPDQVVIEARDLLEEGWVVRTRGAALAARRSASSVLTRAQRLAETGRSVFAARVLWVLTVSFVSLPPPLVVADFQGDRFDASWLIGLVLAVRDHLHWGSQVIWTYGPLGYIDHPVFVFFRQWFIAVTLTVAIQVALMGTLAFLLSIWRTPLWMWLVLAGLLVIPSSVLGAPDLMCLLLGVLLLIIALELAGNPRASSVSAAAAGAILAATALIKATSLISGAATIAIFILLAAVQRRRVAALASTAGFIGSFLLLWVLAAGQNLTDIPAYVHGTLDLAGGYSAAMSLATPPGGSGLFAGLGASLVLAMGISVIVLWKLGMRSGFRLMLLLLPIVALNFKEAFVRADVGHQAIFFSVVVIVAGVLAAAAASPRMKELRMGLLPAACIAVGLSVSFLLGSGMGMPLLQMSTTASEYRNAWTLVTNSAARNAQMTSTSAGARAFYNLPPDLVAYLSAGTVDVIPFDIALAYGYGLAWDPRPVLQSYSAYTPYLDDTDAAHFASITGPDHVLFADESIDDRYPVFDEPATFRALLQHYLPTGRSGTQFLVLSRGAQGGVNPSPDGVLESGAGMPAGTVCGPFGANLAVPERPDQYTFASLRIAYSLGGTMKNTLYKPADLLIQFTVGGSTPILTQPYKLIPATAADGVFVSGYVADPNALAQAFNGLIAAPIRSLRITSANPADYRGTVCASFSTTPLAPQG